MSQRAILNPVRARLTVVLMSAVVVWHSLAMMVASAPSSDVTVAARAVLQPYLTLFRLDNNWGFFAPNVPVGVQFRYLVEDAAGTHHRFSPDVQLNRFHPMSIWMRDYYKSVMDAPDVHADALAAELCREHAALRPLAITLLSVEQKEFLPADRLNGKHPLDDDFVTVTALKTVRCPGP
jgi:hypothetical protein